MSGAQLLEFGNDSLFKNLELPDLENLFLKRLEQIKSLSDLEKLLSNLKPLLKDKTRSTDELSRLRKLRQKAYDWRRKSGFQTNLSGTDLEIKSGREKSSENIAPDEIKKSEPKKVVEELQSDICAHRTLEKNLGETIKLKADQADDSFTHGVIRALKCVDGETVAKRFPALVFWAAASALTSWFIWHQSLALYKSAGFDNATYAAAGGLLLVIGATAYYSITKSTLALLLCIYASSYEGYLMISGTMRDEGVSAKQSVLSNPELVFLKEKAEKEMANYKRQESRYNNPESKIFENGWFKKNFVTPAWEASTKAHEAYAEKKNTLMVAGAQSHITWLKIFYRLGLVFLCMLFVHRLFGTISPTNALRSNL